MNPSKDLFSSNLRNSESPILPFGGWNSQPYIMNHCLSSDLFKTADNHKHTNIFNYDASNKNFSESTFFTNGNENHKGCFSNVHTPEIITQFDFFDNDTTALSDNFIYDDLMGYSKKQRINNPPNNNYNTHTTQAHFNQEVDKHGGLTTKTLDDYVKSASIYSSASNSIFKKKKGIQYY